MHDCFSAVGPKDFPIPTFALWGLIRDTLDPTPSASCLPTASIPGEMAQILKGTMEGYEALEKSWREPTAPMLEESLPPEYELELEREGRKKYSEEIYQRNSTRILPGMERHGSLD